MSLSIMYDIVIPSLFTTVVMFVLFFFILNDPEKEKIICEKHFNREHARLDDLERRIRSEDRYNLSELSSNRFTGQFTHLTKEQEAILCNRLDKIRDLTKVKPVEPEWPDADRYGRFGYEM